MTLCINPDCPQPTQPDNDPHSHCQSCGAQLILQGRYRVMRLLTDSSGFGLVYEAFEQDKPKILKILKPAHNQHPKAIQLFEQEAFVLSRLDHPGVPKIDQEGCFEFQPAEGAEPLHCIVMEKIEGPNLSEWMQQQGNHPISENQAMQWLQQLTEVLHLIHQQQYFHRDIKPDNIMLRANGQLVLVDFGTVREISYTYFAQLESTGGITRISSMGYTAPEQERGQAVPQSDFYSLGCTFIYLLTGKKPLDVDIYNPLTNELNWRPFAPHISAELADFIDRLTALRVIDRPQHTLDIFTELGHLQSLLGSRSSLNASALVAQQELENDHFVTPVSHSHTGRPGSQWGTPDLDDSATLPPDQTFIDSIPSPGSESSRFPPASSMSRGAQPESELGPNHSSQVGPRISSQPVSAFDSISSVPSAQTQVQADSTTFLQAESASLWRHQRWRWLVIGLIGLGFGGLALWGGRSLYRMIAPSFQPGQTSSELSLPSLSVRTTTTLDGHSSAVNALAISLDQKLLASASDDRTVRLWDLVAGQEIRALVGHRDRVQAVAISPNGQIIASGGGDNLIKLWNSLTGEAIANLTGHRGPVNALVMTADGQRLVSASADKTVKIWDLATYQELTTLQGHNSFVNAIDISPDGTMLASGSADRTIKLWDLSTYQPIATLSDHDSLINALAFSLNGNTLISGGADNRIKIWDDIPSQTTHSLDKHTSFVNALAITFDGQYLVSTSADQSIRVWDLNSQTSVTTIPWKNTFVNAVAIRFTGSTWQILAGGQGSDSIQIWNLEESPLQ